MSKAKLKMSNEGILSIINKIRVSSFNCHSRFDIRH